MAEKGHGQGLERGSVSAPRRPRQYAPPHPDPDPDPDPNPDPDPDPDPDPNPNPTPNPNPNLNPNPNPNPNQVHGGMAFLGLSIYDDDARLKAMDSSRGKACDRTEPSQASP